MCSCDLQLNIKRKIERDRTDGRTTTFIIVSDKEVHLNVTDIKIHKTRYSTPLDCGETGQEGMIHSKHVSPSNLFHFGPKKKLPVATRFSERLRQRK